MIERQDILLITPPFTQLNTPYPATCYLTGHLRAQGYKAVQADLSIETALAIFSRSGLQRLFDQVEQEAHVDEDAAWICAFRNHYENTIDGVIQLLQGRDSTMAHRIAFGQLLPEGPRFEDLPDLAESFGEASTLDRARYLSSLYLDDISDMIQAFISPHFSMTRYGEALAESQESFAVMNSALNSTPNLIDEFFLSRLEEHVEKHRPHFVGFSVPFPGNLYSALRGGQWLKKHHPNIKVLLGGGYINTELRYTSEQGLFSYVDHLIIDDGERPLERILARRLGTKTPLCRTLSLGTESDSEGDKSGQKQEIIGGNDPQPEREPDQGLHSTYDGLPLNQYLSIVEVLNPMHRLWSEGRWNKLTLAHGCYWKKCAFCDVSLDYIGRYVPFSTTQVVDRMEKLIEETGQRGFHFVDEAAPPALLKELALEILRRRLVVSWWGNVRFEKRFDKDLCRLLAASGAIAISGGLEVASDRLLERMKKGVTVAQVAQAAANFTNAGIMVHAYLMYGFPTQTAQETIDSLEHVRQLFAVGVIHSGFWHRFNATAHSPAGLDPSEYSIEIPEEKDQHFARYGLQHIDKSGCDPELFAQGLKTAMFNFMNGQGLDLSLKQWFDHKVPRTRVPKNLIQSYLGDTEAWAMSKGAIPGILNKRVIWIGYQPRLLPQDDLPKSLCTLLIAGPGGEEALDLPTNWAQWIIDNLTKTSPTNLKGSKAILAKHLAEDFEGRIEEERFEDFLRGPLGQTLQQVGLLLL